MISPRASKRENSFYEELARASPFRSGPDSRTPRYETTLQGIYQVDEESNQMMPVGDPISNLLQMPKSPTSSNSRNAPLSPSRSYGRTQSSPVFSHNGRTCSHTNEKVHTSPTYLLARTHTHTHTHTHDPCILKHDYCCPFLPPYMCICLFISSITIDFNTVKYKCRNRK